MENQHRKIKNYRELSQVEIDLMNLIKEKGNEILALEETLSKHLDKKRRELEELAVHDPDEEVRFHARCDTVEFDQASPYRWLAIGKTDIQTGVMALVRAIARPRGV